MPFWTDEDRAAHRQRMEADRPAALRAGRVTRQEDMAGAEALSSFLVKIMRTPIADRHKLLCGGWRDWYVTHAAHEVWPIQ